MKKQINSMLVVMFFVASLLMTGCERKGGGLLFGGGDKWVDLGLPSGLLWASYNVGASSPEEYGDYFAWGETQPKSYYGWGTYRYCYVDNDDDVVLKKYCNDADYGYVDNLTQLVPVDDAATVNWGNGARTPTAEEWQELLTYTTSHWDTLDGVPGRRFRGVNGRSIFLPAAGCRWDSSLHNAGSFGVYSSGSLSPGFPSDVWYCDFNSGRACLIFGYYCRYDGLPVRAVRSGSQN